MAIPPALPLARTTDLHLEEVGEELLVYDELSSQIHLLEKDAASVWRSADGTRTVAELTTASSLTPREVTTILQRLSGANLLAAPWSSDLDSHPRLTRRQALRRVGLAAGVISMVAPAAAAAQSQACVPFNQCSQTSWGRTCCDTGLICARDLRDNRFACFAPVFCDDPDFWQVDCNLRR